MKLSDNTVKQFSFLDFLMLTLSGGVIWFGWWTVHYIQRSIDYQQWYPTNWDLITWLQQMGIFCSVLCFISLILLLIVYRKYDVRIVFGEASL